MHAVELSSASEAQFLEIQKFRARRVTARISASDAVATLLSSLVLGEPRGDLIALANLTGHRVGTATEAR